MWCVLYADVDAKAVLYLNKKGEKNYEICATETKHFRSSLMKKLF